MEHLDPNFITPEFAIPASIILFAIWFVMGSKNRREARKARK